MMSGDILTCEITLRKMLDWKGDEVKIVHG
jgi:hypothetical protein